MNPLVSIIDNLPHSLYIGRNGSAAVYYLKGLLDEVRIYNRTLSDGEIQQLYSSPGGVSLSSLSLSGSTTVNAGATAQFSTIAAYSDSTSKSVSPTWSISGSGATISSSGLLTASSGLTSDAVVTVGASYTENGATKTASQSVTIKAALALTGLTLSCPSTVNAGASASCSASASYSNDSSNAVSVSWSSTNSSILSVSGSTLIAGTVTTDTPVSINASYTENGVTKTATAMVTVKAAVITPVSLLISGVTSLKSGETANFSATVVYSDGTTKSAGNVSWASSGSGATIDAAGKLTAGSVSVDAAVTITATYIEGQTTKTATTTVTVKAAAATLASLEPTCPASLTASSSGSCTVMAVYSDGTKLAVTSATWTVTPSSVATVDASGIVSAAKVAADTMVTVNVSYTENGKTVTASKTITVKAAACLANTGEITVSGAAVKKLGDSLDVRYRLCNFNKATYFDVYVAVQIPDGKMLFLSSSGFFGTPTLTLWDGKNLPAAYLPNTLVPDLEGSVLSMSVLPLNLPTGTYTFYAIPVLKGADVMNGFNWMGSLAACRT